MNKPDRSSPNLEVEPLAELGYSAEQTLLVHQETLDVSKEKVLKGHTHIQIKTHIDHEKIELPLTHKKVQVEVTPVNEYVDLIPDVEQVGNVTKIPVFEERVELVKRIYLKEIVTITHETTEQIYEDTIALKKQETHVSYDKTNKEE